MKHLRATAFAHQILFHCRHHGGGSRKIPFRMSKCEKSPLKWRPPVVFFAKSNCNQAMNVACAGMKFLLGMASP